MEKLGIDVRLLGFQIFNFLVIILLLNRLVFQPLSKKMDERKKLIEKGLDKEKEADRKLAEIEVEKRKMIASTNKDIDDMMVAATKKAEDFRTQSLENTRKESDILIKRTKDQLAGEKEEMLTKAKEDVVELTMEAVRTVLGDNSSSGIKEALNQKAIEKLWQKDKTQS
jgi:F-type H+-transporting ATPase subunit b